MSVRVSGSNFRKKWSTLCLKKVPTFKLSVTSSNLKRFSNFFALLESVWNLLQNRIWQYPLQLRHVATLPWKIKHSNLLQIFSRCERKCKQIAFWMHRWLLVSRDISRTVLWVCGLSSWLKAKSLTVLTFSSMRTLCGLLLLGRLSTVPVSRKFFNSLLTPRFVQLF